MKKLASILLVVFAAFSLFAEKTVDFESLAREGTAKEIAKEFKSKPGLSNQLFGSNRQTFLMMVLQNNRSIDEVKVCIQNQSDINAKAKDGRTPAMFAAQYCKDPEILETIIESGTITKTAKTKRATAKDSKGKTVSDYANMNSNAEVAKKLQVYVDAEKSASTNKKSSKNKNQSTPKKETIEVSFQGPDISEEKAQFEEEQKKIEEEKYNAPEPTVQPEVKEEVIPPSIQKPVEEKPVEIETPKEIELPKVSVQPQSMPKEVEPEPVQVPQPKIKIDELEIKQAQIKNYTETFLLDSIPQDEEESASPEVQKLKIENVNVQDKNGVSLLMKACKAGNDWEVKNLLEDGADVQLRDKDGWTALMYAVRYQNNISIINMLIEKGAYIRVRNKYNATPLLMAADYSQNPEILSLLLKKRSNTEEEVYKAFVFAITGTTSSDYVKLAKVQLFLDMEIPLNRLWKGKTPLMYACEYGHSTKIIKLLLDNGAKPGYRDQNGKTAFDYAKANASLAHDDTYWSLNSTQR